MAGPEWFMPYWWVLVLLASLGLTWLSIVYARHRQLLDQPGERRSHHVPTARGGGISIVLVMLAVLPFCLDMRGWPLPIIGLALVAAVGWWDDHRSLPALPRLAVHLLAAGLLGAVLWLQGDPIWLVLFAIGLAVVLTNVWNFMDGINGIAASQALLVALAVYGLVASPLIAALGLALALACAGFLPFNFPHARVFMGDVGSGALGYLLAMLVVLAASNSKSPAQDVLVLMLPLSAFLIDAGYTLLRRMLCGERWWQPHRQHLYQQLTDRWQTHWKVTLVFGLWTALCVVVAILMVRAPLSDVYAASIGVYVLGAILRFSLRDTADTTGMR